MKLVNYCTLFDDNKKTLVINLICMYCLRFLCNFVVFHCVLSRLQHLVSLHRFYRQSAQITLYLEHHNSHVIATPVMNIGAYTVINIICMDSINLGISGVTTSDIVKSSLVRVRFSSASAVFLAPTYWAPPYLADNTAMKKTVGAHESLCIEDYV